MAKHPRIYERLSRPPFAVGSYNSLWLASDHLLQVQSVGFSESYQRYDFADIEAFIISPSGRRWIWALIWGVALFIPSAVLVVHLIADDSILLPAVFTTVLAVPAIWNWLLGPACRVHLRTPVQTVHIKALVRRRKAMRILGKIQPLIEAAQASRGLSAPGPTALDPSP